MVATDLRLRSLQPETCDNNGVWVNLLRLCTTWLTLWRVERGDNDEYKPPTVNTAMVFNGDHAVFRTGHKQKSGKWGQPVARPLSTHRTAQEEIKRTQRHPYLKWDSNPRSQRSSGRRRFMP
jgi:hypothetical protein